MTNKILLRGCAPEPLIHYLKALGILRLVAEQFDKTVRGAWTADGFLIETEKTEDELIEFFSNKYEPTPLVSPWNMGSGFHAKEGASESGKKVKFFQNIKRSTNSRFENYRKVIIKAEEYLDKVMTPQIAALSSTKKSEALKPILVPLFRNEFSDEYGIWLDAVCLSFEENELGLPPLMGSAGNDGNFEFSLNFMGRLYDALPTDEKPRPKSEQQLRAALFINEPAKLEVAAVGQFYPAGAGGVNQSQGVSADYAVNPWDFILGIEGTLMLASATVRQLQAGARSRASFPFTAGSSTIGYGTATDGEKIRAEMWLPIWSRLTSYAEISHIFKEGRVQFTSNNKRTRSGFDFARAVAELGVDRGIEAFQRYAFIERNGQANLATPLGVFCVPKEESPLTSLVNEEKFNQWLGKFQKATNDTKKTPSRFVRAIKNINEAIFKLCADGQPESLREVFIALGVAERELAKGESFREDVKKRGIYLPPLSKLTTEWAWEARDDFFKYEYEIAQALASINGNGNLGLLRSNLEPIEVEEFEVKENGKKIKRKRIKDWTKNSPSATWNNSSLTENLANILQRRSIDARSGLLSHPQLQSKRFASLDAVAAFLNPEYETGETDDEKIEDYLFALILVNWDRTEESKFTSKTEELWKLPRIYALFKLLFLPEGKLKRKDQEEIIIKHEPSIIPLLRAEKIDEAVQIAERRLKSSGVYPLSDEFHYPKESGARLAASLLIPISQKAVEKIADLVLKKPEKTN